MYGLHFFPFNPLWDQFTEIVLFVRVLLLFIFQSHLSKRFFKRNAVTYISADLCHV